MAINEGVTQAVFSAVDEVNQQLPKEQQLEKSIGTVLVGQSGKLDSLGLVNLIVTVEQKIEEEFGITITLTDDEAMSQEDSPFETIGKLIDYVSLLLERKSNGQARIWMRTHLGF
jgi:acyl carrier protein